MKANNTFLNQSPEFWANIKIINQKVGYVRRRSKKFPKGGFTIPTVDEIKIKFKENNFDYSKLVDGDKFTELGKLIINYMEYRAFLLSQKVEPLLMNQPEAQKIFYDLKKQLNPSCPLPMNKQKKEKKDFAFLTGIINMLIEQAIGGIPCDYDPRILTTITKDKFPIRSMSRRVDGAFPSPINPKAIWEIKEYYYTTTFGSRVADGVYETQLDGWELLEINKSLGLGVEHYLIVDSHYTWWGMGKSYLCRLIDAIHMGLVTEVIFGKEALTRIPIIAKSWLSTQEHQITLNIAADPKIKYKK